MTMGPIWKTCPKCKKKYSWNPDVGRFFCPHCHGIGEEKESIWDKIFKGKKKEEE